MTFRPDIGDGNWGGFEGATCRAASQTIMIDFVENGNVYKILFIFFCFDHCVTTTLVQQEQRLRQQLFRHRRLSMSQRQQQLFRHQQSSTARRWQQLF